MNLLGSKSRRFVCLFLLICLSFWPVQAVEPDKLQPLSLAVWVIGSTAHFRVENTGSKDILLHKALKTPYDWPEACWIQVRDRSGKIIVTSETDESGYWSPLFYAASANVLPVELQALPAGESWEEEADLQACLESFAAWPLMKASKDVTESKFLLEKIAAVKITFQVKLDRMLSRQASTETDWIPFAPVAQGATSLHSAPRR